MTLETKELKKCEHNNFVVHHKVGRLTSGEGGPVTGFVFEAKVQCSECGQFFEFIGLPGGTSYDHPTTNFDFTELRQPIRPFTGEMQKSLSYQFQQKETKKGEVN